MRNGDSNPATFITCPPRMAYAEFLLAVAEPDFVKFVGELHIFRDTVLCYSREADAFLSLPVPEPAGLHERGMVAVVVLEVACVHSAFVPSANHVRHAFGVGRIGFGDAILADVDYAV